MDDIRNSYSTPFDNPLIPRFPIKMRNAETLTSFVLPFGELIHDYLCPREAPHV